MPDLDFLYELKREGIKLDLETIRSFLKTIGDPQNNFKSVHVAGTNGKGSVSCMLYNILKQKFRVGLYTSPHLVRFNERIILKDEFIPDSYIDGFMSRYKPLIVNLARENRNPTFYETTTAMAFNFFSEGGADFASVEVGLGGRLDATNVIIPEVSVITSIGYEHSDRLGTSLEQISIEKGGIIKEHVPVVLGERNANVVKQIRKLATIRESEFIAISRDAIIRNLHTDAHGTEFKLLTKKREYRIKTRLLGDYQVRNIATSVLAAEILEPYGIERGDIERGISHTIVPGRMEIISSEPLVVLDSAHNPQAMRSLVTSFKKILPEKPHLVIGMLSDKNHYGFLRAASSLSDSVTFTTPDEPVRAESPNKLLQKSKGMFRRARVIADPVEAYRRAREEFESVLVTGSIYLTGIIKKIEGSSLKPFIS